MSFLGQGEFNWAIGVVEDRHDPDKLGRVRVRWLGIHTEDKEKILTKDLSWSTVMQSSTGTNVGGMGDNTNIVEGTWVVGFSTDPGTLQEWIVMGTLPGKNITSGRSGGNGRSWAKGRGDLKKIQEKYNSKNPNLERSAIDYEKGFYDPTTDLRNVPYYPSDASYGNPVAGHSFTPPEPPPKIEPQDTDKKITRVPNYTDSVGGDHPNVLDLNGEEEAEWEYEDKDPIDFIRATHTDVLHYFFKTTRRLTADKRFKPEWDKFGTFRWPDANTYYKPGFDQEPEGVETDREFKGDNIDPDLGREGIIISTGYLEPELFSEDRSYGNTGGTYGPSFPITRDTPTYVDPGDAEVLGISPNDTRADWGKQSGEESSFWGLKGENIRVNNPRVRWVKKGNLTPTEFDTVKKLFEEGHYGTGDYCCSEPKEGRQDIKWGDISDDDLVIVPTPDTNALAMGGIPIESCDGKSVTTKSSLWADSTSYFSDPNLSRGAPAKPLLQSGDIVQIAGVRGMQEINGRIFRALSVDDSGGSFKITLGTEDGKVWSGPGNSALKDTDDWSEYLGGGVVIPHYPHWSLCWKADMRERQINIGSPDPETGNNAMHWNQPTGDYNARYPFNKVYESESGHIMEYDDTPGAERIHQFHRSGTHYEIDHNGTKTNYVKGDNYDIRLHDDYMYVKGKVVHTFDDEVMIRFNDRADISANWKLQLWSGGDLDIHSKRNINFKSDGDINLQADGHLNLHGTGVTAAQTNEYRAGSRNKEELSKIRLKAGHVEIEAIGDEAKPKQYGVFMQSNQAPIGMKTLHDGDSGDIHIAASEDLELFAWKNQYREARKENIYDYTYIDYRLGVETGDINVYTLLGKEIHTIKGNITHASCNGNIHLDSTVANIYLTSAVNIELQSVDIRFYADNDLSLVSNYELDIQNLCGDIDIKASQTITLYAAQILAYPLPITLASDPGNVPPATPITITNANPSKYAYIPETMELLSIDLPNPRPAVGTSVTQLALNPNNVELGLGGENIRNLHDTIENLQQGLSAYVTKKYPPTKGKKAYEEDQSAMVRTGGNTADLEVPWTGYEDHNITVFPLGPEKDRLPDPGPLSC